MEEGTKHDSGKPRYDLISPDALRGLVDVLTFGATKYTPRNWSKGILYGRVFRAVMTHLWDWWNGLEADKETGMSPLDHAACCIHFLSHYEKGDYDKFDDRPRARRKEYPPKCISLEQESPVCLYEGCIIFHPHRPCRYSRGRSNG